MLPVLLLACTSTDHPFDLDAATDSRCQQDADWLACAYETDTLHTDWGPSDDHRDVHWQVPLGDPPAEGWPAVLLFQGTGYTAELFYTAEADGPWGLWHQGRLVAALLDQGFAVFAPEAHLNGDTWWDTNVVYWQRAWERSRDHALMETLLAALADGEFGPVDTDRLYATGISSGGYMTSRMAVSYAEHFAALAIQSASYATCSGRGCRVEDLERDHPPTLFLHGDKDKIVPAPTMTRYADDLDAQGTETRVCVDEDAGHEWLGIAPTEIPAWFTRLR